MTNEELLKRIDSALSLAESSKMIDVDNSYCDANVNRDMDGERFTDGYKYGVSSSFKEMRRFLDDVKKEVAE